MQSKPIKLKAVKTKLEKKSKMVDLPEMFRLLSSYCETSIITENLEAIEFGDPLHPSFINDLKRIKELSNILYNELKSRESIKKKKKIE